MRSYLSVFLVTIFAIIIFVGCSTPDAPPVQEAQNPPAQSANSGVAAAEEGYPSSPPATPIQPAYPVAEVAEAEPTVTEKPEAGSFTAPTVAQPAAGTGSVVGRMINLQTDSVGNNIRVYLGQKVEAEPGPDYFISFQLISSPQAETDENGYFVINDVAPGTYVLIVWTPTSSLMLEDSSGSGEYWVEVAANQVSVVEDAGFALP